jgi:nucleoid-associated protein YgaU
MGFFDFVKDAGRQIFNTDAEAADNIREHLEVRTSGIRNLEVEYDDGVATLCGDCVNQATKDSAVLIAGNLKGVEKVNAEDLRVDGPKEQAVPRPEPQAEFYTIEKGDTLSAIAKRYYGDVSAYTRIFEANKDIIEDPDRIFPGQKIRIPKN